MLGGAKSVAEMTGRLGGTALDEETGKHVFYARNEEVSSPGLHLGSITTS